MEWTIEHLVNEDILYIKTRGVLTAESGNAMVKEIVLAAARFHCDKQIIDHRQTTFSLKFIEYYQRPAINQELGILRTWKIAMVFKEFNENTHFMENVFRNRGYNFREFVDVEEAKMWLAKK